MDNTNKDVTLIRWVVGLAGGCALGLALIIFLVVQIFALSKDRLNYGFNTSWKIFTFVYNKYYENIPNRITSEYYWLARKKFDEETKNKYWISTLENWEREFINKDTNSTVYNFLTHRISSSYGVRYDPFKKKIGRYDQVMHSGIDLVFSKGTDVVAFADGIVSNAGWNSGYGRMIIIDHTNGFSTLYGHLSRIMVKKGDMVEKGSLIALSGNTGKSTGAHLHFEIRYHGEPVNPYFICL